MQKRKKLRMLVKMCQNRGTVLLTISLIIGNLFVASAQSNKGGDTRELFTQANLMMSEHLTDSALKTFLILYHQDTTNANICYFIARIYLNSQGHKTEALPYLEEAVKNISKKYQPDDPFEKAAPPPAYYYLARAQHLNYQFDEAILNFSKFQKMLPAGDGRQKDIEYWINCCNNAKMLMESPVDCKVVNLGDSINSPYPDYNPAVSADESEMLFTSNRPDALDSSIDVNGHYYADIWISYPKPGNIGWTTAQNLGSTVNTHANESTISLSPDGQELILYRSNPQANGNLLASLFNGLNWTYPVDIDSSSAGIVNGTSEQTSACLSPDKKTIYFASDRPGGFGGLDIYEVSINASGELGKPVNLGPDINTEYDEDAPFIHPDDSTMFFSSKGHNTMGGYDVFIAKEENTGHWSHVRNIGYPINTPDDDTHFSVSADGRRGFYTSIRKEGLGEQDIYEVFFHKPLPVQQIAVLVGYIKSPDGDRIPNNIMVTTHPVTETQSSAAKVNPETGKFLLVLRPNRNYNVVISSGDKIMFNHNFYLPADSSYLSLSRAFFRTTIILGDTANVFVPNSKTIKPVATATHDTAPAIATPAMSGRMLLTNSPVTPLANMPIQLLDEHGHVIQTTLTNSEGYFTFDKLNAANNYVLRVNVKDSKLKHLKQLLLANSNGKMVRNYDKHKKLSYLYHTLPPDLNNLPEYQVPENSVSETVAEAATGKKHHHHKAANENNSAAEENESKTAPVIESSKPYKSSGKVAYIRHFGYNKNDVSVDNSHFKALIDKIAASATYSSVTVYIEASASKVPTQLSPEGNEALAMERAKAARDAIIEALWKKQINPSRINFEVHYLVQGPAYKHDAQHLSKYRQYQYVKVYIR